jgi:hypothetical protein
MADRLTVKVDVENLHALNQMNMALRERDDQMIQEMGSPDLWLDDRIIW